jgi:DNA modification methylase
VDVVVTSPPYWAQRAYTDGGEAYDGQIGSEPTPWDYLDVLLDCTAEWVRVLKPSGSLFVNLGDKYATRWGSSRPQGRRGFDKESRGRGRWGRNSTGVPEKSLVGLPWRYALGAVDELGLTLRAEIVWDKPNGLPESVDDRVRRSHEQWFHLTRQPRYFQCVDAIREQYAPGTALRYRQGFGDRAGWDQARQSVRTSLSGQGWSQNELGKLPGSVWSIPTEPLDLPKHLAGDDDHYAAFPPEWPRRFIAGFCPERVCTVCGQGRELVTQRTTVFDKARDQDHAAEIAARGASHAVMSGGTAKSTLNGRTSRTVVGETCACPTPEAASTPGVALDPFGGTGTTAQVAHALGRTGISVDLSRGYARLAADDNLARRRWAKVHELPVPRWDRPDALTLFDAGE